MPEAQAGIDEIRRMIDKTEKWMIIPLPLPIELPLPHYGVLSFHFRQFDRFLHFYLDSSSILKQVATSPSKLYAEDGQTIVAAFVPIKSKELSIINSFVNNGFDSMEEITNQLSNLFDMALEAVNELIVIVGAVTRNQRMKRVSMRELPSMLTLTLLSRNELPADIPFAVNEEVPFVGHYTNHDVVERVVEVFRKSVADGHPFILPSEMILMAGRSFSLEDYRLTVINLGTGFEAFVSALLRSIARDQGVAESEIQEIIENNELRPRVTRLGRYISGNFDMKNGSGPLGTWYRGAYKLRNRAVHAGYIPSKNEANEAIQQTQEAISYLRECIKQKSNEFPETLSYIDYDISEIGT